MRGFRSVVRRLNAYRFRWAHARHRRRNPLEYRDVDEIIGRYRDGGGLAHPFQAYKLFELRQLLAAHAPQSILELGSGSTTAVFADYVRTHPGTQLTVVDDSRHWLDNARTLAGAGPDEAGLSFHAVDKEEDPSVPATRYAQIPEGAYDFVLVDGPSLRFDGVADKRAINDNILDLAERLWPETVLVDIRKATAAAFAERFAQTYEVTWSDVIRDRPRDDYQYFTVFRKRAGR